MSRGKAIINLERFLRCHSRLRPCLVGGHQPKVVICQVVVCVGQTRVSRSVVRVCLDRFFEIFDPFVETLRRSLVPVIPPLEEELIRFRVLGISFRETPLFLTGKLEAKLLGNFRRDIFLHGEDVHKLPVVLFTPQMLVVAHFDQLGARWTTRPVSTACTLSAWPTACASVSRPLY